MTLGDVGASTTCGTRTHAMTPRPKQASELRVLYIHTRAGAASHTGTLTPMLHLTTSQYMTINDCLSAKTEPATGRGPPKADKKSAGVQAAAARSVATPAARRVASLQPCRRGCLRAGL